MNTIQDLKQSLIIDEQKIENSLNDKNGLNRLRSFLSSKDEWYNLFNFDSTKDPLSKFLLFKTASGFRLYKTGYDDPDCTPDAMQHLKNKLIEIPSVESVYCGKEIAPSEKNRAILVKTHDNSTFLLESDTGISLMTKVGYFFRTVLEEKYGGKNWPYNTYMQLYKIPKDTSRRICLPYRNFYYYSLLSNKPDDFFNFKQLQQLQELNIQAKTCHTFENLILVPYGYNAPRGTSLKTYLTVEALPL